jgi:hypothetical protein
MVVINQNHIHSKCFQFQYFKLPLDSAAVSAEHSKTNIYAIISNQLKIGDNFMQRGEVLGCGRTLIIDFFMHVSLFSSFSVTTPHTYITAIIYAFMTHSGYSYLNAHPCPIFPLHSCDYKLYTWLHQFGGLGGSTTPGPGCPCSTSSLQPSPLFGVPAFVFLVEPSRLGTSSTYW